MLNRWDFLGSFKDVRYGTIDITWTKPLLILLHFLLVADGS